MLGSPLVTEDVAQCNECLRSAKFIIILYGWRETGKKVPKHDRISSFYKINILFLYSSLYRRILLDLFMSYLNNTGLLIQTVKK